MKKINALIEVYQLRMGKLVLEKLNPNELLKEKIKLSKSHLQELRIHTRGNVFHSKASEISFFKHTKPKLCAEIILYSSQLNFLIDKPNSTVCLQIEHIKNKLNELENGKARSAEFYRYYKHSDTVYDDKYFLRSAEQNDLFSLRKVSCLDPDFNTSHDTLAAHVIAYDLLSEFYHKEIQILKEKDKKKTNIPSNDTVQSNMIWPGSKTDLVELIYAIHNISVLEHGNIDIKEITFHFEKIFNVSLGDYYRIFHDIRFRKTNQTKFLDKLKDSFVKRLQKLNE